MVTFRLNRFSSPEALKAIQEHNLLALLGRYETYFRDRGVELQPSTGAEFDYESTVQVLMTPDESTPRKMVDDLYYVHEMATAEGMDALREAAAVDGVALDLGPDPTPADVAVQVRLKAPDLIERKHAESFLTAKRSFEYFQVKNGADKPFSRPAPDSVAALEKALADQFEVMKRGRTCKVFNYEKEDGIWFLVRHGEHCKRAGAVQDGASSSVYYRPERYDVLKYDEQVGELCLNAETKKIGELYREQFGLHLFGDAQQFPGTSKYTLEPLRTEGVGSLVCSDVEGMEAVLLKEIQYLWGGPQGEIEIRRAKDLFAALEHRGGSIPPQVRILRASFQVKFMDAKTPRVVSIRPPNVASYTRDSDTGIIEDWLQKRGFATDRGREDARTEEALGDA